MVVWMLEAPYLRVFLLLQVLCDIWVEVLGVALVQAVDLPLFLDLHILVHQDELSDGLRRQGDPMKHTTMFGSWPKRERVCDCVCVCVIRDLLGQA